MKRTFFAILLLLSIPFLSKAGESILISTSSTSEVRKVRNFNAITSNGAMKVYIKIGNVESLKLVGDQEAIENIVTEVKNGHLNIKNKFRVNNLRYGRVSIYITTRSLSKLALNGSGDIRVESPLRSNHLTIGLNGSGAIRATGNFHTLVLALNGSGITKIDGKSTSTQAIVTGSGKIDASLLKTDDARATVTGSGNITIDAKNALRATLTGSGSIYYHADPEVRVSKTGSGKIRKT